MGPWDLPMKGSLRGAWLVEYVRGSLWVLPTLSVVVALVAGATLVRVDVAAESAWAAVVFGGGADGARAVLEVVAGSVITVTSVTFSLTVVTLQMAASQYTPRLLRNLLRDRGNQVVLSVFLATFAFCIVVLRTVRSGGEEAQEFVPRAAVAVAVVLALASLAALVYFIHHLTQEIRVERILGEIAKDTLASIEHNCEAAAEDPGEGDVLPEAPRNAIRIPAHGSGYLQTVKPEGLLDLAHERDVTILFRRTVGEEVAEGTVLAWAWSRGAQLPPEGAGEVEDRVNEAVRFGGERTLQQDIAFGLRQLVDIAVKALSPSLNDPTTAVDTLGQLSVILRALAVRNLGGNVHVDDGGTPRVCVPYPGFADYLGLACAQIAQYGGGDPAVVRRLFSLLEDVGDAVSGTPRGDAVLVEIDRVLAEADRQLQLDSEKESVHRAAVAARQAVAGARPQQTRFTL